MSWLSLILASIYKQAREKESGFRSTDPNTVYVTAPCVRLEPYARRAISLQIFVRRALRPFRLAAGGAAPARGVGVDGQEVADLGDAFDAGSYA